MTMTSASVIFTQINKSRRAVGNGMIIMTTIVTIATAIKMSLYFVMKPLESVGFSVAMLFLLLYPWETSPQANFFFFKR